MSSTTSFKNKPQSSFKQNKSDFSDTFEDTFDTFKETTANFEEGFRTYVKKYPLKSIFFAAFAGFIFKKFF